MYLNIYLCNLTCQAPVILTVIFNIFTLTIKKQQLSNLWTKVHLPPWFYLQVFPPLHLSWLYANFHCIIAQTFLSLILIVCYLNHIIAHTKFPSLILKHFLLFTNLDCMPTFTWRKDVFVNSPQLAPTRHNLPQLATTTIHEGRLYQLNIQWRLAIQLWSVKGRKSFKVIHNQDQWRKCSMCDDTMNVAIQSQLVKGRKGVKVKHNQDQWRKCSRQWYDKGWHTITISEGKERRQGKPQSRPTKEM